LSITSASVSEKIFKTIFFLSISILCSSQGDLTRRAYWGVSYEYKENELVITDVVNEFSFAKAKVIKGDIILSVNNHIIQSKEEFKKLLVGKSEGAELLLKIKRSNKNIQIKVIADPYPYEKKEGVTFEYGSFTTTSNDQLRTIISKPEKSVKKLPAILFIQWLSCDHVESQPTFMDGNVRLIHDLSKAGYLVMRTDKPGVGDSKGKPCDEYGFDYELQVHKEALQKLKQRVDVDTNNIFILGSSMGGTMAPMVAQNQPIRGLIVTGCYYKTWYEHMLEIERRISYLDGDTPFKTYEKMQKWSKFYSLYLNDKMTPGNIINKYPEFKDVWQDGPEHQYGRNVKYYMEAIDYNVADYWSKINIPVLVIYGAYDYIMSKQDHEMIADAMNSTKEGLGTFLEIPKMDHGLNIYDSQKAAYTSFSPVYDENLTLYVLTWLKKF